MPGLVALPSLQGLVEASEPDPNKQRVAAMPGFSAHSMPVLLSELSGGAVFVSALLQVVNATVAEQPVNEPVVQSGSVSTMATGSGSVSAVSEIMLRSESDLSVDAIAIAGPSLLQSENRNEGIVEPSSKHNHKSIEVSLQNQAADSDKLPAQIVAPDS